MGVSGARHRSDGDTSAGPPRHTAGRSKQTTYPPRRNAQAARPGAPRFEEVGVEAESESEAGGGGGGGVGTEDEEEEEEVGEGGGEEDCEDPDSAYVNAMEKIWAEAEAWVDAEAQVTYRRFREFVDRRREDTLRSSLVGSSVRTPPPHLPSPLHRTHATSPS